MESSMNDANRRTRVILSIIGIIFIVISLGLNFVTNGMLWSWVFLGAALVALLLSRRYR